MASPFSVVQKLPYTPIKNYIHPTPRQPTRKGDPMTIAAAFRCNDGVLLAADTLITFVGGSAKKYESKLFQINVDLDIHLAYAGDPYFVKDYVEELRKLTTGKTESDALSLAKQVSKRMFRERRKEFCAGMLLTIREGSSVSLYLAEETHFTKVDKYAVLGIGFEQAEALVNPYYRARMGLAESEYLARYVLYKVKKFVQHCGGDTEIKKVRDDGALRLHIFKQVTVRTSQEIEDDFAYLDRKLLPLLLAFSDLKIDKKTFRKLLNESNRALEKYRNDLRERYPKILEKALDNLD